MQQTYLIDANRKYVAGLAVSATPFHSEIINELAARMKDGRIQCKGEASKWIRGVVVRSTDVLGSFD